MKDFDSFFEIADDGNLVRVEVVGFSHPEAKLEWDKNWLSVKISLKGGAFSGSYNAAFMIVDFERFKKELDYLSNNLTSTATFYGYERCLEISINGDGIGHLTALCTGNDNPNYGGELKFEIEFDQSFIPSILKQLNVIINHYTLD